MGRMLCLCNTFIIYTRVIQKDWVYPILNNWYDDKSKTKTMVEDRRSSRRLGNYWWSWLGCTPKKMETVSDRPDGLGDRWICGVLGASGFVQTQNGLVNGLCVWHWILFCVDWSLLNIHLFGGGEFILLLNALLWDVRAQRLCSWYLSVIYSQCGNVTGEVLLGDDDHLLIICDQSMAFV